MKEIIKYIENATKEIQKIAEEMECINCNTGALEKKCIEVNVGVYEKINEIQTAIKTYKQVYETTTDAIHIMEIKNYIKKYKEEHSESVFDIKADDVEMENKYVIVCDYDWDVPDVFYYYATEYSRYRTKSVCFGMCFDNEKDAEDLVDYLQLEYTIQLYEHTKFE